MPKGPAKLTKADRGHSLWKAFKPLLTCPSPENVKALEPHVRWFHQDSIKATKSARRSQSFNGEKNPEVKRKRRSSQPRLVQRVHTKTPKAYTSKKKAKLSKDTQFQAAAPVLLRRPAKRPAAAAPPRNLPKDFFAARAAPPPQAQDLD